MDAEALKTEALGAIEAASAPDELDELRVHYLGRKSELKQALRGVRDRESGMALNAAREAIEEAVAEREAALERAQLGVETIVIRLGRVPFMDATGLLALEEIVRRFQRRRVRVLFCGMHHELRPALQAAGIYQLVGEDNFCASMRDVATRVNAGS